MSDPTDDLTLLASAYLDGEATPDERALVETSVDALAEVERLARVRTVLEATVEPVSLAAREAHLAAALDVWERMRDSTGDTPVPNVDAAAGAALTTSRPDARRARRQSSWTKSPWILGAAAAMVLTAGVAAVFVGGQGQGNDSSESASAPAAQGETTDTADADGIARTEAASDIALASPEGADPLNSTQGDLPLEEDAPVVQVAGSEPDAPPPDVEVVVLNTPTDLADAARVAVETRSDLPTENTENTESPEDRAVLGPCEIELGVDVIVTSAIYIGQFVTVGVDLDGPTAFAYDAECRVVGRTIVDDE